MKRYAFFALCAALLALVLLLPGCKNDTTPPQPPPPDNTDNGDDNGDDEPVNNGTLYYAAVGSGTYVFLSIYSDPPRSNLTPRTGDSYAVGVYKLNTETEELEDAEANPIAAGTIVVTDETISFGTEGIGTINGEYNLDMITIPGTDYTDTLMEWDNIIIASSGDPFGPAGPSYPGDNTGGSGGNTGGTPTAPTDPTYSNAARFTAGRVVESFAITAGKPFTFKESKINADTKAEEYWEGYPANLEQVSVTITYDDGTQSPVITSASQFSVDPPFFKAGAAYTIRYIGEGATNTAVDFIEPAMISPPAALITIKAIRAKKTVGATITPILPAIIDEKELSFEGKIPAANNYFEDARLFSAAVAAGHTLQWDHDDGTDDNFADIPAAYQFTGILDKPTVSIDVGSFTVILPIIEVYTVKNVTLSSSPSFNLPVIFDDGRLTGTDAAKAKRHWFSRLSGMTLTVNYDGIGTTHNVTIADLLKRADTKFSFTLPSLNDTESELTLRYFNKPDEPISIPVSVYNRLVAVLLTPKSSAQIVLEGSSNTGLRDPDDEVTFMHKFNEVNAVYQLGRDRTKTIKRNLLMGLAKIAALNPAPADANDFVDFYALDGTATLTTNMQEILTNASTAAWDGKFHRTQDAEVHFTTGGQMETGEIEIGVTGIWPN